MKDAASAHSALTLRLAIALTVLAAWCILATALAFHERGMLRGARSELAALRGAALRADPPPLVPAAYIAEGLSCENRASPASAQAARLPPMQADLLNRVRVLALRAVAEMETTIRLAGLDVDEVAPDRARRRPGQPDAGHGLGAGGPYVAPGDGRGQGGGLNASLESLDVHLNRWEELNRVIHSLPLAEPLAEYRVASGFGLRMDPLIHRPAVHEGIDLAASIGTPVFSTAPGWVVFSGVKPGYGHVVEIDHGNGVHTLYGHLRMALVHGGQHVGAGARIGRVGSSGRSTGPHLHYEIRVNGIPRDPAQFLYTGRLILAAQRR